MVIEATDKGTKREQIPAGSYAARCYEMIHIGTNTRTIAGKTKVLNEVRISWELPTETRIFNEDKGPQPFVISKEYTLSMNEKANLRKDLEAWRGKEFTDDQAKAFDISVLLGVECLLGIIHKDNYARISSIGRLPKGMDCPPAVNPLVEWNYTDKFDIDFVETLPDFIKDKITSSQEWQAANAPDAEEIAEADDDIFIDRRDVFSDDDDDSPF